MPMSRMLATRKRKPLRESFLANAPERKSLGATSARKPIVYRSINSKKYSNRARVSHNLRSSCPIFAIFFHQNSKTATSVPLLQAPHKMLRAHKRSHTVSLSPPCKLRFSTIYASAAQNMCSGLTLPPARLRKWQNTPDANASGVFCTERKKRSTQFLVEAFCKGCP